jgi:IS30 family transposase
MDRQYTQLSLEDRCAIATLHAQGRSIRQIATALDRSPSTISRELKRNHGREVGYKPTYAQAQTRGRRWKGSRLERNPALLKQVLKGLKRGWSPEQVCGALARQQGHPVISPESIYRFIHAQIARTKDYSCDTTSRAAKANVGSGAAKAARRPCILSTVCRLQCARRRSRTARLQAIGKAT